MSVNKAYLGFKLPKASYLVWLSKSNRFLIVKEQLYKLLQRYFNSKNRINFLNQFSKNKIDTLNLNTIYSELETLNTKSNFHCELPSNFSLDTSINNTRFSVYKAFKVSKGQIHVAFQNKEIYNALASPLMHLSGNSDAKRVNFYVFFWQQYYIIANTKTVLAFGYKTQTAEAKTNFGMALITFINNLDFKNWGACFHAATLVKNHMCISFFGPSGSGKTTLSLFLVSQGYTLLTDDISPFNIETQKLYSLPFLVSVKQGSIANIKKWFPNSIFCNAFTTKKGPVHWFPFVKNIKGYCCKTRLFIALCYDEEVPFEIKKISSTEAFKKLIPETWIKPTHTHIKEVINWLSTVRFYELHYNQEVEVLQWLNKFQAC